MDWRIGSRRWLCARSGNPANTKCVLRDVTLDEIEPRETAIFIFPGGDRWENGPDQKVDEVLQRLHTQKILIGALCAATLEIARSGLTAGARHTSNSKS